VSNDADHLDNRGPVGWAGRTGEGTSPSGPVDTNSCRTLGDTTDSAMALTTAWLGITVGAELVAVSNGVAGFVGV
jgi:hypothetical protein